MRPEFLPDGHGRLIARRSRIIAGNGHLPPLNVDDLRIAQAAANDDRSELAIWLLVIGGLIAAFSLLGVAFFMIGRGL